MKRRLLAGLAAIALAAVGGVVLLSYVGHADARAMAGLETLNVLVVKAPIPIGTTDAALPKLVGLQTLPAKAVAPGTLSSLASIAGLVTTAELHPGEQLFASRFANPATLAKADETVVPKGMQQVTLVLSPERAAGGFVAPGLTVGVFLSLPKDDPAPAQTHLVLHKVLVTKVEGGKVTPAADDPKKPATNEPATAVMVTLAVTARSAEIIVYGAEHGTLYLSLEGPDAAVNGTRVVTRADVSR